MAKLNNTVIGIEDFREYLDSSSDFGFEMKVLKRLENLGLACEHGGHYEDPVTKKSREFDIRAIKDLRNFRIRLAIECKNIRANFPILVSCVPRREEESYHQVAWMNDALSQVGGFQIPSLHVARAESVSVKGNYSLYKAEDLVGKSTSQVGRAHESIVANDQELYEKWGQCIGSAYDLVKQMYWDDDDTYGCVIPFVVVPEQRLWMVEYNSDGSEVSGPKQIDRCACYVNKAFSMGTEMAKSTYWVSHVEIMTVAGLERFVLDYLQDYVGFSKIFPIAEIDEAFRRNRQS